MYKFYYLNLKTPLCFGDFVFENLSWKNLFCQLLCKQKDSITLVSPEQ